jgi:membrane peptidoglycan carboxypeptidase
MMRAVFESNHGTAKGLRISGYELGGKTGTAQKTNFTTKDMKGGGHVSNFVGFVPAENPQAVILVMIDNPKAGKYYGGAVAGPVFKSIAQNVIRRLHVARADGRDESGEIAESRVSGPRVAEEPVEPKVEPTAPIKKRSPQIEVSAKRISQDREAGQSRPRKVDVPSRPTPRVRETPRDEDPKPTVKKESRSKPTSSSGRRVTKPVAEPSKPSPSKPRTANRTIRIIEPEPKKSTVTKTVKRSSTKGTERPADIQTRRSSAIRLEGGLSPRIGGPRTTSPKKSGTASKSSPTRTAITRSKSDQSPVTKKRVNRDR